MSILADYPQRTSNDMGQTLGHRGTQVYHHHLFVLCGAAQTIDQLIMFRWCQGVGGGGVFGLVQLIFLELVPRKKLPAYMTMVMSTLALALIVGPLLGGGITLHGSWRWIFLIK
jgi:MFS family permease